MSIRTTNRGTWTLTLLRDGKDAQTNDINQAKFHYGRQTEELENSSSLTIPDALITLPVSYTHLTLPTNREV